MIKVLYSSFHGALSNNLLLIRFRGRKSGTYYQLPVAYAQDGDIILIASKAGWWKNLRDNVLVELRLRGRNVAAHTHVATDRDQRAADLRHLLQRASRLGRYIHVEMNANGEPNPQQLAAAIDAGWVVVHAQLSL